MEEAASHSDALLYLFNGGALLTIVGLFIHLIRVTIPKKDAETLAMLTSQSAEHRAGMVSLIQSFRDDIKIERDAHDKEVVRITSAVDKLSDKLDRMLDRNDRNDRNSRG